MGIFVRLSVQPLVYNGVITDAAVQGPCCCNWSALKAKKKTFYINEYEMLRKL